MTSVLPSILSQQQRSGKKLTPREKSTIALAVQKRNLKEQKLNTTTIWREYNAASGPSPTFESEAELAMVYGPRIEEANRAERFYALRRNRIERNLNQVNPTWDDDFLATYTPPVPPP